MNPRASGILLHVSSLPSRFGIGDFGPAAIRWIDDLAGARQRLWQMLPLNPTDTRQHDSPYQPTSAFAGNPLLISPECLRDDGLLTDDDVERYASLPAGRVDFAAVAVAKRHLLDIAFDRFSRQPPPVDFDAFCRREAYWLGDFALFVALGERFAGQRWVDWPPALRDREPAELVRAARELDHLVARERFTQYIFDRQWSRLHSYARRRGVTIIGDLPFYVGQHCADVWCHRGLFKLTDSGRSTVVAGVPPDAFSATGQLWGTPVYDWHAHADRRFDWWVARLHRSLHLCDTVRLDHFRGIVSYWEIDADAETAVGGRWVDGPGEPFVEALRAARGAAGEREFSSPSIIAEDLGVITPEVRHVLRLSGFPGINVLLFAFDEGSVDSPYLPHRHGRKSVVYTGTHDNNTVRGWYENEATPAQRQRLADYLGREPSPEDVPGELIRLAMMSVAEWAVIPLQDVLGLGESARMNHPARSAGNWTWRLEDDASIVKPLEQLALMSVIYGRT